MTAGYQLISMIIFFVNNLIFLIFRRVFSNNIYSSEQIYYIIENNIEYN